MELKVTARTNFGKGAARQYRKAGQVPAIVYGGKNEPAPITVSQDVLKTYIKENGMSQLLTLDFGSEKKVVLFKKVEREMYSRQVSHIDFQEVDQTKKVERTVSLHFVGTPVGVSTGGGLLLTVNREVLVSCLPKDIPSEAIELDITDLAIGDSLHASDITLPAGVELSGSVDLPLVTVSQPKAEEEAAPAEGEEGVEAAEGADAAAPTAEGAEGAAKEPEVVAKKGKKEE
jgi:large subunit ribosomal protein L25